MHVLTTAPPLCPLPLAAAHAARIGRCNLALDARRWGAHTTALDALWAGVGTLSVPRETLAYPPCLPLPWRGHPLGTARDACLPPLPPPPLARAPSRYRARREAPCMQVLIMASSLLPQVPGETLASRAALSIHSAIGAALLSAASLRAGSDLAAALALDTAFGLEGPEGRAPTTAPSWMTPRRPSRRPVRIESVLDQTVNT